MSQRSVRLISAASAALVVTGILAVVNQRSAPELTRAAALTTLDLSAGNRHAPITGLYDWSKAGYRGGANLPGASEVNPSLTCQVTPARKRTSASTPPEPACPLLSTYLDNKRHLG